MTRPQTRYEYKVVPAPTRGAKGKGVKGNDGKFANALETAMNDMAAEGWEYQRAETLPSEERAGLTSKTTVFRNVLVFRRALQTEQESYEPEPIAAPEPDLENDAQEVNEPEHELDASDTIEDAAQNLADEITSKPD